MAEGYTSWNCPDLGNATLYCSDYIHNPDWSNGDDYCPLVRPYGFHVMALFDADIDAARAASEDYDSGIKRIARIYTEGALTNWYLFIRVYYRADGDLVRIVLGDMNNNVPQSSHHVEYTYPVYHIQPEYCHYLYIMRQLYRTNTMEYDTLPNYTGNVGLKVLFGAVRLYVGVWNAPDNVYIYGHMVYTWVRDGEAGSVLLSIPCAANNTQSRSEQSESVFRANLEQSWQSNDPDTQCTDYEGHFNPDPDNPRKPDPNEEDPGGESGEGGGGGQHIQPYVPIPIPGLPTIGPNSAGFVYMLRLTVAQMQQFALDLVRPTWWTALKNFFADPLDFICGIMIVPYEPVSNYSVYPKFGENVFEHAYPQVYQQYTEIDCGGLPVPKYFGSCFDNNPYTELLLWLPYIGYRKLDPDECVGKTIYVKYHCDCLTGDCVAFVMSSAGEGYDVPFNRVIAQFSGNCGVRVPFGSTSFDAAIAASVQLLGGAVGAIAGGALGAAVGVSGASIGASQIGNSIAGSTVSAVNGSKVTSERSGVSGACAGYLSIQYPYLLRTVPNQSLPKNYQDLEGYPSNIAGPLTKFSGFTAVETIDLNGLSATKEEIDEIKQLLIGGVYI